MQGPWRDAWLELSVDELRGMLELADEPISATWRDRVSFALALPRALVRTIASAFS